MKPLSIRTWKERRAPWHALVFWVWLAGFVFSFAASELCHAPHCPEMLELQWAGQQAMHPSRPAEISPATPLLHVEVDCAACAFQLVAAAITSAFGLVLLALFGPLIYAAAGRLNGASRSLRPIARGPPVQIRPLPSL